jgi:hypothetical protein
MGLLDDAIREHLDLKRRRGADPGEVERDEREALGPVRRVQAPEDAELDAVDEDLESADGVALDHASAEDEDDSWTFEDEFSAPHTEAAVDEDDPEPDLELPAEPMGQETAVHRPDFLDDEGFDDKPEYESGRRETPLPHPAQEPAERAPGIHADPEHEGEGEGEELLEETPEFLQDTPDHDRLWFEQRPPKDFDFDG